MKHKVMCCQNLLQIPTSDEGIAELCINEETSTDYKAKLIGVVDLDTDIPQCCKTCEHKRIVDTAEQRECKHTYRPIEYNHVMTGYEQCEKCGHIRTQNGHIHGFFHVFPLGDYLRTGNFNMFPCHCGICNSLMLAAATVLRADPFSVDALSHIYSISSYHHIRCLLDGKERIFSGPICVQASRFCNEVFHSSSPFG